jgi:hypothetical protein
VADADPIIPYIRLTDLSSGDVVAATRHLLVGTEVGTVVNAPGPLTIVLSVAEQGEGPQAVSDVLLSAVGGADGQQARVPIFLEFSLDGGVLVDASLLVQQVQQDASKLTMTVTGQQIGVLYGRRYLAKTPYPLVTLADALGAPAGTIPVLRTAPDGSTVPGILGASHVYPFLAGIFQQVAAGADWAGRALLKMTPVLDPAVAWQVVTERSYADTLLKVLDLLCQHLTSDVASADARAQPRGTFVLESCSPELSLSAQMPGIVTGGSTRPSAGHPGRGSDAVGGVRNAVVVGHVGTEPFLTVDGTTARSLPEDGDTVPLSTATLTRTPDTTSCLREIALTGGDTRAGLPPGGKITRITCLHRTRAAWPHPAWGQANLPLVAVYGSERVGGLYTTFEDGRLHPVGPAAGIHDLAIDDLRGRVYIATDEGVYRHSTNLLGTREPWVRVGALTGKVRRLQAVVLNVAAAGTPVLESYVYAHVAGSGAERDGVYRHDTARGKLDLTNPTTGDRVTDTSSGIGDDLWTRLIPSSSVVDMVATDHHSVWYLDTHDLTILHRYDFTPTPGGTNVPPTSSQTTDIPLLGGGSGTRLDRVLTAAVTGHPAQDSIWIGTKDDGAGLQVVIVSTDGVVSSPFAPTYGNADHSLADPDGQALIVQRCVGLGLSIDHVYYAVFACTTAGLFAARDLSGTGWQQVSDGGLGGYSLLDVAGGQSQQLAGTDGIQRLYAASEDDLLISGSAGTWWEPLGQGSKVELTTYFVDLARTLLGTYPDNDLVSLGPDPDEVVDGRLVHKSTAALGAGLVPALSPTLRWERRLDEQGWVTWCVDTASSSTNQDMEQVTEVQADAVISDTEAAQALASLAVRQLQEQNEASTGLTLTSRFTRQGARLRRLKPTMRVGAAYVGELRAWDADGHVVDSRWMDLSTLTLYVLSHTLRLKDGGVVETETSVSTSLRTRRLSLSDWAASLMHRVKALALHRA